MEAAHYQTASCLLHCSKMMASALGPAVPGILLDCGWQRERVQRQTRLACWFCGLMVALATLLQRMAAFVVLWPQLSSTALRTDAHDAKTGHLRHRRVCRWMAGALALLLLLELGMPHETRRQELNPPQQPL